MIEKARNSDKVKALLTEAGVDFKCWETRYGFVFCFSSVPNPELFRKINILLKEGNSQ